jgi:hypothetical protein
MVGEPPDALARHIERAMSLLFTVSLVTALLPSQLPGRKIQSVVLVGDHVLASTRSGLFRSSVTDKRWLAVKFPQDSVGAVTFATRVSSGANVYAFVPLLFGRHENVWNVQKFDPVYPAKPGLYKSIDSGLNWKHINSTYTYAQLYHFGNVLYAIPEAANKPGEQGVLVSKDSGTTWSALPNVKGGLASIFPDPDHPDLVCLRVHGIRGYVWQAQDANYTWKVHSESNWKAKRPISEQFESGFEYGVTLGYGYMLDATLENYFEHEFGLDTSIPGLQLSTGQTSYTFSRKGPKKVQIDVAYLTTQLSTSLLDNPSTSDFWSVSMLKPNGEMWAGSAKPLEGSQYGSMSSEMRHAFGAEYRRSNKLQDLPMSAGEHYTRMLDLNELGDFKVPGVYKVKIRYDNSWAATTSFLNDSNRDKFHGFFTTKTFTVTITD